LTDALDSAGRRLDDAGAPKISGHLVKVSGITLEAAGCAAPVGARCLIDRGKEEPLEAEVAGFSGDRLLLTPLGDLHGISPRARVTPMGEAAQFPVGPALLGRVIDGTGEPIDGKGSLKSARRIVISNGHSVSKSKYRMVAGQSHRWRWLAGCRRGLTLDERTAYNVQVARRNWHACANPTVVAAGVGPSSSSAYCQH
ncbi:MAG: flagellar biosynthesis/type III secretory pathway ATPase, partial [Gammaproteobacteria bacterium]